MQPKTNELAYPAPSRWGVWLMRRGLVLKLLPDRNNCKSATPQKSLDKYTGLYRTGIRDGNRVGNGAGVENEVDIRRIADHMSCIFRGSWRRRPVEWHWLNATCTDGTYQEVGGERRLGLDGARPGCEVRVVNHWRLLTFSSHLEFELICQHLWMRF